MLDFHPIVLYLCTTLYLCTIIKLLVHTHLYIRFYTLVTHCDLFHITCTMLTLICVHDIYMYLSHYNTTCTYLYS